jgi:hypothetical protein
MRTPSDLRILKLVKSVRRDLSVFSLGIVHSKRRRSSLGVAVRSTILLGTIVSQGTGGAFLAQPVEKIKIVIKDMIVILCNFNFLLITPNS